MKQSGVCAPRCFSACCFQNPPLLRPVRWEPVVLYKLRRSLRQSRGEPLDCQARSPVPWYESTLLYSTGTDSCDPPSSNSNILSDKEKGGRARGTCGTPLVRQALLVPMARSNPVGSISPSRDRPSRVGQDLHRAACYTPSLSSRWAAVMREDRIDQEHSCAPLPLAFQGTRLR